MGPQIFEMSMRALNFFHYDKTLDFSKILNLSSLFFRYHDKSIVYIFAFPYGKLLSV